MRTVSRFTIPVVVLALACQPTGPADTSAEARQAIETSNARWAQLSAAGHADSIAELYAMDAVIMPPNMAATSGRDGIRAFFGEMNALKPTLALRTEGVTGMGSHAVEMGRWTFTWPASTPRPPGVPPVDSGKYIAHWVRDNASWQIKHSIWNSDLPMPEAPAAPAPARKR